MSYIHIDVECDTSEVDRELVRVLNGPNRATHLRFDATLSAQFARAQVAVHVVTGSLKASGNQSADGGENGSWKGEISFGGSFSPPSDLSPGPPRNPGYYAEIEFDRGGPHNWIEAADLHADNGQYADAITDWMREGTG